MDTTLFFLISQSNEKIHPEKLTKISDYLAASNLHGSISNIFTDLLQLSLHYQKTIETLHLGQTYQPEDHLYNYYDFVMPHLYDLCNEHINYRDFACGVLEKLENYDRQKQSSYFETLYVYLIHNQQITPSASFLHIHENTLRYRIDKIESLINYSLSDGKHIMELLLAYSFYYIEENLRKDKKR